MTEANHTEQESAHFAELKASIEKSLGGSLDHIYGPVAGALRQAAIDGETLKRINDSFRQMAGITAKLASLKIPPEIFRVAEHMQQFQETIEFLRAESIQRMVAELGRMKLPEPFLSDALLASGLNSSLIHSPTYVFPRIEGLHPTVDTKARAEDAWRRRLVDAYDILSQLEHSLRDLIETKLREVHGDHWWKRGVPEGVRKACEERKHMKEKPFEGAYHPICYAYVDDYRAIITKRDNWDSCFSSVFDNKIELEACFNWVARVRDPVMHARPPSDKDYLMFMPAANWLRVAITRGLRTDPL